MLIALGFALSKKFSLDSNTLTKINFYLFTPAFAAVYIYTTEITADHSLVFLLVAALLILNYSIGFLLSRLLRLKRQTAKTFQNSLMFFNSGNIGVSLIILVFSNPPFIIEGATPYLETALSVQVMVMIFMTLSTNTLGIINSGGEGITLKTGALYVLKMPVVYAVACAFLLKLLPLDFTTTPFWPVLTNVRNGLVGFALVTLGVQLAKSHLNFKFIAPYIAVFCRLIVSPAAAFLLIKIFGFSGVMAQTILIASCAPAAVNTALLAVEYKSDADFAVQTVTLSTLLSAVTMTVVVYLSMVLFR